MNIYSYVFPVTDHLQFVIPQRLMFLEHYVVVSTVPSLIHSASLFSCFFLLFPRNFISYPVQCRLWSRPQNFSVKEWNAA